MKKLIVSFLLLAVISYLLVSYLAWNINISNWSAFLRFLYVLILIIGSIKFIDVYIEKK